MAAGKIAELFVQVGQRGLEQTRSQIAGFVSGLGRVGQTVKQLAEPALRLGGLLAGAVAPFVAGALRGTAEGEQLSKSLETLGHVVADRLAPYVRMLALGIQDLARWYAGLDQSIRDSIAQWVAVAAAAGAFLTAVGLLAAAIGALLSPVGLVLAALAALATGIALMYKAIVGSGEDAADSLNASNTNWVQNLVKGLEWLTVQGARAFNWLARQGAMISDFLADKMAAVGEKLGFLPEGTLEELRKMPPIQPIQIDEAAVAKLFDPLKRAAKEADDFLGGLLGGLTGKVRGIQDYLDSLQKRAGGKGLTLKMDVGFESMQGTFDRLQKALATPTGSLEEAALGEAKQTNEKLQRMITEGIPVKMPPVVGE